MQYWIIVASKDHLQRGLAGGFIQASLGKAAPLKRMHVGGGFVPFRRNVSFLPAQDVSILPLINQLTFIKDKTHWGVPLRFGTIKIPEQDFRLIAGKMVEDQGLLDK